jgi:hypothetical protein
MKNKLIALVLVFVLISVQLPAQDESPNPQPASVWVAACVVVFAGAMAIGTAVVIRNCKPKYYCMKDSEGTHFIGTATKKERQINGWVVVSGPYDTPDAGTNNCPPPATNSVAFSESIESIIHIQESTNLVDWVTLASFQDDPGNFSYQHTNTTSSKAFYRAMIQSIQ